MRPTSPAGDDGTPTVQLPPRPNLGPEPWPAPDLRPWLIGGAALIALLTVSAVLLGIRRRNRRATRGPAPPAEPVESKRPSTPRGRLIRAAEGVRTALTLRHGPSWAARTTEEIAADPATADWLGPDRAAAVVRLLARADEAKFAGLDGAFDDRLTQGELEAWDSLAAEVSGLAAGATSTSRGR